MNDEYRICNHCVMDTTDPDIGFDEYGVCNHCRNYDHIIKSLPFKNAQERHEMLNQLINDIKTSGYGRRYDCIIGLSGGIDSSYVAYIVTQLGLRPLAVHVDNGWNSELAIHNIEKIVRKLKIDLRTFVIDWEEFKELQRAFLMASVVDIEMLSDNGIIAGLYRIAKKGGIKYFLAGTNIATEAILPQSWCYHEKWDSRHIRAIYKKFGNKKPIRSYPLFNFREYLQFKKSFNIRWINILDYIDYNKKKAMDILVGELGWRQYGGKHYESIITRFYQGYILMEKFNIDKRKAHLSNLICSGQITRDEALRALEEKPYDPQLLQEDKEYFLKKMSITKIEFERYINTPRRSHGEFPSYAAWCNRIAKIRRIFSRKKKR